MTVNLDHSLRDRVIIKALDKCSAIIEQIALTTDGTQYRIAYWHNGERITTWVGADEIE